MINNLIITKLKRKSALTKYLMNNVQGLESKVCSIGIDVKTEHNCFRTYT